MSLICSIAFTATSLSYSFPVLLLISAIIWDNLSVFWGVNTICSATGSLTIGLGLTFVLWCVSFFIWAKPVAWIWPFKLNPAPWLLIFKYDCK